MYAKKLLSLFLALTLCVSMMTQALAAPAEQKDPGDVSDRAVQSYTNNEHEFIKISHPETPSSTRQEKHVDGLVDYLGNGKLGVTGVDEGANGQGDRGQTYSWAAATYGDWMYVSTLFNASMNTVGLMGSAGDGAAPSPEVMQAMLDTLYRGDFFVSEEDGKNPASTLCKINVKTGEVKILMSRSTNGLGTMFRYGLEYKDKLYFAGSVNGVPSVYEVDPRTDAFRCVYKDATMEDPKAWQEALYVKKISPAIRGMAVFQDHLVISCVGLDANPYIAISDDPSAGAESFTTIASSFTPDGQDAELLGYPACHLADSIYGGSIWEIITFNDRLYVACCTGTPANSPDGGKSMQSFAIIRGECSGDLDDPDAWSWTPIVGDKEQDGAKYTFGIDPERTRSGACSMMVLGDHLYVGEYNDTEIALIRMLFDLDFEFMADNLAQSVSLYRMDSSETFELVSGTPTAMFPKSLSGLYSGFGKGKPVYENQYIWQMTAFQDQLYAGTFDESSILYPLAQISNGDLLKMSADEWKVQLDYLRELIEALIDSKDKDEAGLSLNRNDRSMLRSMLSAQDALPRMDFDILSIPKALSANSRIDTPADLYAAMVLLPSLMEMDEDWTLEQRLEARERFCALYEKLYNYFINCKYIPQPIRDIYAKVLNPETFRKVHNVGRCLYYLKDSQSGFDLVTTADGVHFDCITRSGLGDPYNQGLRAFAVNHDVNNPWLCVGTANPFYGTQIWRMEGDGLNLDSHVPAVPIKPAPRPEKPDAKPEKPGSGGGSGGGSSRSIKVTFSGSFAYDLGISSGSLQADGSLEVSFSGGRLPAGKLPQLVPTDDHYKVIGWAVENEDGELEPIDLGTYRFTSDVTLHAVYEDTWTPFKDMKADRSDWYYQETRDLAVAGVIGGYADGTFRANVQVTWGTALKMVLLAAGYPEQDQVHGSDHACSGYLIKAKAEGIVDIDADIDLFQPISRLDFARLTARALKLNASAEVTPFTDTDDALVTALNKAGIINGYGDGRFAPDSAMKRSHIAAIIWRVNQYNAQK